MPKKKRRTEAEREEAYERDRLANQHDIKKTLAQVIEDTEWLMSEEGLARVDDKSITPEGILRDVVINLLHQALANGFDYRRIILSAALGFAAQNTIPGDVHSRLEDLCMLAIDRAPERWIAVKDRPQV